jgi:signal transduction histidine kinase
MHNARLLETAKRDRARAEEAQVLRERLLAIVGHDLRNPLAAIAMTIQSLRARQTDPTGHRLVARIESSAGRMSRLIGEVLDFASIRQGMSLPIKLESADLHEICRSVVDELRLGHPERDVVLRLEGHPLAACDADRIAEVVSNLVGNAIQHSADGPVDVLVREAQAEQVAIAIHNLGWIPAPARNAIFDAYHRGPTPDGHPSNSIGLGLYIANEIVKAHHGTIELASTPDEGTTFTVLLPR